VQGFARQEQGKSLRRGMMSGTERVGELFGGEGSILFSMWRRALQLRAMRLTNPAIWILAYM